LILVTKGDFKEQTRKVQRSGLEKYFSSVEVVSEKDHLVYLDLVKQHRLASGRTWMVGNSPKSDINPALRAGLNAVFVPHNDTWILEHEELAQPEPPRQMLVLKKFAELKEHF
jgi:putative hydrolase of the HAD superfamily